MPSRDATTGFSGVAAVLTLLLAGHGLLMVVYLIALDHPGNIATAWSSFPARIKRQPFSIVNQTHAGSSDRDIVAMYIFSATNDEFFDNLKFFVQEAVLGDTRCDYVLVVQGVQAGEKLAERLPSLPAHARYVFRDNQCYDWGTFGWLLTSGQVPVRRYKYFFFINCSVRGPYLPAYARGLIHWTQPFLARLSGDVKLVGPTISCEGSPLNGNLSDPWRHNPHVQSYAMATDRVGLSVLLRDRFVFRCHSSRWHAIYHAELGSSAAMLAAGYNIDSFMTRYQGVDWRQRENWGCNGKASPQGEHMCDGYTLDPIEVMFVKLKSYSLMNGVSSARKAVKYEQWMHPELGGGASHGQEEDGTGEGQGQPNAWSVAEEQGADGDALKAATLLAASSSQPTLNPDITTNEYLSDVPRFKIPKVLEAKARGPTCFDFDYYLQSNPDLAAARVRSRGALWKHFMYFGQFELRRHRFTCPFDYERFMTDDSDEAVSKAGA